MHRHLVLAATALLPLAGHAQWSHELELSLQHDDNLSRAQRSSDIVSDFAAIARAATTRSFPAGERGDFSLGFEGKLNRYARFDRASFLSLGASAGYRRKLGLGLTAPRISVDAWIAEENAVERVRDGRRHGASLAIGRRFDEAFEASLGMSYEQRIQHRDFGVLPGTSGKPFALQGRTLFARASLAAGTRAGFFGSAELRNGDVESSTRRNAQIFFASSAISPDPAIGPDFVAYRLSGARTRSLSAGGSYEIDRRSALQAAATWNQTDARAGLEYRSRQLSFAYVYRP